LDRFTSPRRVAADSVAFCPPAILRRPGAVNRASLRRKVLPEKTRQVAQGCEHAAAGESAATHAPAMGSDGICRIIGMVGAPPPGG